MFNSQHELTVHILGANGVEVVGQTPAPSPGVEIPAGVVWYVKPISDLAPPLGGRHARNPSFTKVKLDDLVKEMASKRVPGLSLVGCCALTGDDMAVLAKVPNMTYLDVDGFHGGGGPMLGKVGLAHIAQLSSLEVLGLCGVGVVQQLGKAGSSINLDERGLTDEDLRLVGALTRVRALDISMNRRLTAKGLEYLSPLSALESLNIRDSRLGDDGIEVITQNHPGLKCIDVSQTLIGDAGLERIGQLKSLQKLDISGCVGVTDSGLSHLYRSGLRELRVEQIPSSARDMRISYRGLAELRRMLPGCVVLT
jgi:hypothetical protein